MQNKILKNLDLKHIWHPCTQMKDHETLPLIPIKKAKGVWLYDFDDKAYIDLSIINISEPTRQIRIS